MKNLDWNHLRKHYAENPHALTKEGEAFSVISATDQALHLELSTGTRQFISRANLEKAVALKNNGVRLAGPGDYREKVSDERPAYAWAILRDMGIVP